MENGLELGSRRTRLVRTWQLAALLLLAIGAALRAVVFTGGDYIWRCESYHYAPCTIIGYTGHGGAVTIPSVFGGTHSVASIGFEAFYGCTSLTRITIPKGVAIIERWAFGQCTNLTNVTIPTGVGSIEDSAFSGCTSLARVTMPSSVYAVGDLAFQGCSSLASVTIPNRVGDIGNGPFSGCDRLTTITVAAGNPDYSSLAGVLFDKSRTLLIQCPGGKAGGYTIPASVSNIGDYAFSGCHSLTSITIPASVTTIGVSAFRGCTSLTSITIPASVSNIGDYAFSGCTSLTSITIPASVTTIGVSAFEYCTSLASITIPASVTSIGTWAFYDCTSLTEVFFLGDAPSAVGRVFSGANQATVYYVAGTTGWGAWFDGRPTKVYWPRPTITGLNPTHGPAAGGISVVISGADLTGATAVRFGSTVAAFTVDSATQITATAPAGSAGQTVDVSITTAGGTSADTATDDYAYDAIVGVAAAEVALGYGLWDLSGTYATTVGVDPLALTLVHDLHGKLAGTATLQVNTGKAVLPLTMAVKGSAKGSDGVLLVTLTLKGGDAARELSASLAFDLTLNVATRQLEGPATGSIAVNNVSTSVGKTVTLDIPLSMNGTWALLFELRQGARGIGGIATLTLANGVEYRFAVTGRAAGSTAVLSLPALPSDRPARAISLRTTIETLGGAQTELTAFSGKAYGQSLRW